MSYFLLSDLFINIPLSSAAIEWLTNSHKLDEYEQFSLVHAQFFCSFCNMIKKTSMKYYRDEKLLIKIGKNLSKTRQEIGISLKMLSDQSSIPYSHLIRIELGKVNFRISILYKLAEVLGIDPGELLS